MTRWWSYFFLLLPLVGVAVFAAAPALGWSFPETVSTVGKRIDFLYAVILFLTGTVFIGTQLFLFYVLFRFGDRPGRTAKYIHGNHRAELTWTLIPAVLLAGLLALQTPTWLALEYPAPDPYEKTHARIVARRFEWRVVHAGKDGRVETPDDVVLTNELHIPPNVTVLIELQSTDVIHSLFLPQLRMKQDAVPGMNIAVRFDAVKTTLRYRDENARLRPADFRDLGDLAAQLKKKTRGVDKLLAGKLSAASVVALETYDGKTQPTTAMESDLLDDLNRLVESEDFAAAKEFEDIDLSPLTSKRVEAKLQTKYRRLVNRDLLTDAYPAALRPLKRDYEIICAELCGEGHFQMHGRLIVHESAADYEDWLREAYAAQEKSP